MLTIVLAATVALCDARATLAGELMALHQDGASRATLVEVAEAHGDPAWSAAVLPKVFAAETSEHPDAKELAAFHLAAEIHALCVASR